MIDPTFFHQRHQQGAGLLDGTQASLSARPGVRMAGNGCVGADHQDLPRFRRGGSLVSSSLNHAQHRHLGGFANLFQGQRAGCIAGDDQKLRTLVEQKASARKRIAHNGGAGFRPIRQPRRVAQVQKLRSWQQRQQRPQHGQPSKPGVEYADLHRCFTPGASEARYTRVRSAWPASVSRCWPSTRKRTCAIWGKLACSVPIIESRVSVSGSIPEGWASTNDPLRSTTATVPGTTWLASRGRVMKNISFTPLFVAIGCLEFGFAY